MSLIFKHVRETVCQGLEEFIFTTAQTYFPCLCPEQNGFNDLSNSIYCISDITAITPLLETI